MPSTTMSSIVQPGEPARSSGADAEPQPHGLAGERRAELERHRLHRRIAGKQLLGETPPDEPLPPPAVELPPKPTPKGKPRDHGRSKLPDDLRREERIHAVAEAERRCPHCGGERICIGYEVSETLERKPAELYVIVDKREKLACHPCEQGVATAPGPDKVIDKGRPGPGLLADVMVGKYVDHLPLNRQHGMYRREGVDLPVSTMVDWVAKVAASLAPLAARLEELVLAAHVLNADDTGIKVLDRDEPNGARKGHLWCYVGDATYGGLSLHARLDQAGRRTSSRDVRLDRRRCLQRGRRPLKRTGATSIESLAGLMREDPLRSWRSTGDARAAPVSSSPRPVRVEARATETGRSQESGSDSGA